MANKLKQLKVSTPLVTPKGQLVFSWPLEKRLEKLERESNPDKPPYFKVQLIFDESDEKVMAALKPIKDIIVEAAKFSLGEDVDLSSLKMPLKSSKTRNAEYFEKYPLMKGKTSLTAKTQHERGYSLFDINGNAIGLTESNASDRIYNGCYCLAKVTPWVYHKAGNRGVGLNIHAVRVVDPGERFGGYEVDNDDFANAGLAEEFGYSESQEMLF